MLQEPLQAEYSFLLNLMLKPIIYILDSEVINQHQK